MGALPLQVAAASDAAAAPETPQQLQAAQQQAQQAQQAQQQAVALAQQQQAAAAAKVTMVNNVMQSDLARPLPHPLRPPWHRALRTGCTRCVPAGASSAAVRHRVGRHQGDDGHHGAEAASAGARRLDGGSVCPGIDRTAHHGRPKAKHSRPWSTRGQANAVESSEATRDRYADGNATARFNQNKYNLAAKLNQTLGPQGQNLTTASEAMIVQHDQAALSHAQRANFVKFVATQQGQQQNTTAAYFAAKARANPGARHLTPHV